MLAWFSIKRQNLLTEQYVKIRFYILRISIPLPESISQRP